MDLRFETLTADRFDEAVDVLALAFGDPVSAERRAAERLVFEPARTIGAFDGDRMVGVAGAYSHRMSLPFGREAPVAGTTWVAVLPTHTRRGVMRELMLRHLEDAAGRGEAFAALWASETALYGRFGYGLAAERLNVKLRTDALAWDRPPRPLQFTFEPLDGGQGLIGGVYEAVRARRAGVHARDDHWWRFQALADYEDVRWEAADRRLAVGRADGEVVAYVVYGMKWGHAESRADASLIVTELAGVDAAAEGSAWWWLAGHSLVRTVLAHFQPVDDILPWLLADQRLAVRRVNDSLWVRVLDVEAALTARGWGDSFGVTLSVEDPLHADMEGTWRLEVADEGSHCEPADGAAPAVTLELAALGSLMLGGVDLWRLAGAGRAVVHDSAAAAAFAAAARTPEAPWAPEVW